MFGSKENMTEYTPFPDLGSSIETVDTPAVIVDLDKVEKNIERLFQKFRDTSVSVRPHLKTVKSPKFARMLVNAGAQGVCVAKLSEAEVMAIAGFTDILITTEIIGPTKIARLERLLQTNIDLKVVVDSAYGAQQMNDAAKASERNLKVLIEINVGQNRAGVEPGADVLKVAEAISQCSNLTLIGVQGYEGHLQLLTSQSERKSQSDTAMKVLKESVEQLRNGGYQIDVVSTGGTGTGELCAQNDVVTEVQPGSFVFMDASYTKAIDAGYEHALTVLTTVISKPTEQRAVVDAGLKSISNDYGNAVPVEPEHYTYRNAGDEHGIIESTNGSVTLEIGDRIELIPSHIDTTINLHDFYVCHRNGVVAKIWPIAGRGKVQ